MCDYDSTSDTWISDATNTRFCWKCTGGSAIYEAALTDDDMIESIDGMDLFDLIEMFVDWKAASLRSSGGDLHNSIEHSKIRFRLSDQIVNIFKNTHKNHFE